MDKSSSLKTLRREAIGEYKLILKRVLDQRPSGLRNRLAEALGKNRSFVSQITNPAYETPIPADHLPTLFAICHFGPEERTAFLEAYGLAHPERRRRSGRATRTRLVSLRLPDLEDANQNARVDALLQRLAADIVRLLEPGRPEK